MRRIFPDEADYGFAPRTFTLPYQRAAFVEHAAEAEALRLQRIARAGVDAIPPATYIAKPSHGAQGDGIYLVRDPRDLRDHGECVVQTYIDRPLLIDGLKFDLRLYVVLVSVDPPVAHVYREGLARFCTVQYEPPSRDNLRKVHMHLTNYSLNKLSDTFVHSETLDAAEEQGSKRLMSSVFRALAREGHDTALLWRRIVHLVTRTIVALAAPLAAEYHEAFGTADAGYTREKPTDPGHQRQAAGGGGGAQAGRGSRQPPQAQPRPQSQHQKQSQHLKQPQHLKQSQHQQKQQPSLPKPSRRGGGRPHNLPAMGGASSQQTQRTQPRTRPSTGSGAGQPPHSARARSRPGTGAGSSARGRRADDPPCDTTGPEPRGVSNSRCFQIFGFDVMIDADGRPWLLEINSNPSLRIDYEEEVSPGVFQSRPSPLDEHIKVPMLTEALRVVDAHRREYLASVRRHRDRCADDDAVSAADAASSATTATTAASATTAAAASTATTAAASPRPDDDVGSDSGDDFDIGIDGSGGGGIRVPDQPPSQDQFAAFHEPGRLDVPPNEQFFSASDTDGGPSPSGTAPPSSSGASPEPIVAPGTEDLVIGPGSAKSLPAEAAPRAPAEPLTKLTALRPPTAPPTPSFERCDFDDPSVRPHLVLLDALRVFEFTIGPRARGLMSSTKFTRFARQFNFRGLHIQPADLDICYLATLRRSMREVRPTQMGCLEFFDAVYELAPKIYAGVRPNQAFLNLVGEMIASCRRAGWRSGALGD
jgi:hypothetical protein